MQLSFYGAAREVTGSCYGLEVNGKKILVDCGLQQGEDKGSDQSLPFNADEIDFVLLTHAHIDHSGRLPLLAKQGFKGKIFAIEVTCELITVMLKDSAEIQETDAKWENKKARRAGEAEVEPLYTKADVAKTLEFLEPCRYGQRYDLGHGIQVNFVDAGHILGSASLEVFLKEDGISKKIVFSGDIGNMEQPIIKNPQYIDNADLVVMESTYGDRNHEKRGDYAQGLASIIDKILNQGGNVIIPSFALERTQGLLYLIREIKERKLVKQAGFPVYVDSPLASELTKLYDHDLKVYGDTPTRDLVLNGLDPLDFPNLSFTDSTQESKALNYDPVPKVIIASSGMCEGGRIRHHLKHNLWREESAIVFVGFQAQGTLGRELVEGADKVDIYGEKIAVRAAIYNFKGLSAHADKDGLLAWINSFNPQPQQVWVTHGEDYVCQAFADTLAQLGFEAEAPQFKSVYDLGTGKIINTGTEEMPAAVSTAYQSLNQSRIKLADVIKKYRGAGRKEIAQLEQEIRQLAEKWNR